MTESHSSVFTVSSCFYCAQAERRDWHKTAYSHVLQQVLGFKEPGVGALEMIATLTPPEREVFELVVRGMTNKQVGNVLGATERTIKAHRHRVMEKMQVHSLAELVSLAERTGILEDPSGPRRTG